MGGPGSLLPTSSLAILVHPWIPEVPTPLTFQKAGPTGCNSRLSDKHGLGFHTCSKWQRLQITGARPREPCPPHPPEEEVRQEGGLSHRASGPAKASRLRPAVRLERLLRSLHIHSHCFLNGTEAISDFCGSAHRVQGGLGLPLSIGKRFLYTLVFLTRPLQLLND